MKLNERKCHSCGGYGTTLFDGVLRECRGCNGFGKVTMKVSRIASVVESIERPESLRSILKKNGIEQESSSADEFKEIINWYSGIGKS